MNFDSYNDAIEQAEKRIEQAKQKADDMLFDFKQGIPAYLAEYSNYIVHSAVVEEHPKQTLSLGLEKLSQLKKRVSEIVVSFPAEVEKDFDKIYWAHRSEITEGLWDSSTPAEITRKTSESIESLICKLLGQIGSTLISYNLASIGVVYLQSTWHEHNGQILHSSNDLFLGKDFSESMKLESLIKQYGEIMIEFTKAKATLSEVQEEKTLAQVKDLWERA